MLHSNEPMSTQNKVIIGVILVLLFILGVLVTYKILSSKEIAPVVATEEKPLFGSGAQDVILGTATSTEGETNVRLEGGPVTELTTTKFAPGESATITWSSPDAVSCVASGDDKTWFFTGGSPVGSFETPPITKETIYAISCIDALGNATRKTVLVKPLTTLARVTNFFSGGSSGTGTSAGSTGAPTTPRYSSTYSGSITSTSRSSTGLTISLSASKTRITQGESLILTWSFSGDGSCTATGKWSGSKQTSGSESISSVPLGYNTYAISCTNTKGETRSKSLSISGVPPTPTITSFTADTSRISSGGTTTLRWTSVNTTACSTDTTGKWATQSTTLPSNGSMGTQTLLNTTNPTGLRLAFTLRCVAGPGLTPTSKTVSVTVDKLAGPRISISASPALANIDIDDDITIKWRTENTSSCTASGAWTGEKGLSGEEKIGLSGTAALQKYILRCVGPGGSITEEAVVTIVENAPSISIDVNPGDKCSNNRFYTPGPSLIQVKWSTSKPALCTVESDKVASFLTGEIDNLTENGSGSMVIPFDGLSTRITVTCEGGSGTDTKSVTVRGLPVYAASYASDKLRGRCD